MLFKQVARKHLRFCQRKSYSGRMDTQRYDKVTQLRAKQLQPYAGNRYPLAYPFCRARHHG